MLYFGVLLTVCVCLFVCLGVNLLVGTESGLMLLDRSGQGKVYPLINRRRFQQMDVLEGLNVLVTISGMGMEVEHRLSIPGGAGQTYPPGI